MASPNNGSEFEPLQEIVKDREVRRAAIHRVTKNQTGLSNWTPPNNTTSSMPGHFSKWMFGAGSWNRTLLRPLHPLTWYCSTCRNGAPLSGERKYEQQACYIVFSVFLVLLCVPVSREGFCFVSPTCGFLLPCWGGLLRRVLFLVRFISMDQYYAKFPLTFKPL